MSEIGLFFTLLSKNDDFEDTSFPILGSVNDNMLLRRVPERWLEI